MKLALKTMIAMLLLFVTGCNDLDTPEVKGLNTNTLNDTDKDWSESMFGPGPINYGTTEKESQPYDPVTESNVTGKSYRSPRTNHQTINDDQEMIENIIYDMPGVEPGMVIIIGSHAWVNIMFKEEVSAEERENQVRKIEERLIEVNPRYQYQVIVNDYMHNE